MNVLTRIVLKEEGVEKKEESSAAIYDQMTQRLKDENLQVLMAAIFREQFRRANEKADKKLLPTLLIDERLMIKDCGEVATMKAYRARTNCSLTEARVIVLRAQK